MKPYIQPVPEDQPQPDEQPTPAEQPRRRKLTLPTFGTGIKRSGAKTISTVLLLMGFFGAQAQTQPVPDPPSPPGVPTRPMDPNDRPIQPTEPQQPVTPRANPSEGWIMFDERNTKDLGLQQDQLQRLRDVDGRYSRDYSGLGKTPSTNPGYKTLSDRRDADVRGILTPDQYVRWKNMHPTPDPKPKN